VWHTHTHYTFWRFFVSVTLNALDVTQCTASMHAFGWIGTVLVRGGLDVQKERDASSSSSTSRPVPVKTSFTICLYHILVLYCIRCLVLYELNCNIWGWSLDMCYDGSNPIKIRVNHTLSVWAWKLGTLLLKTSPWGCPSEPAGAAPLQGNTCNGRRIFPHSQTQFLN